MLPSGLPPSWVMPGAKYDFDFANHRYWNCNAFLGIGDGSLKSTFESTIICGNSGAAAGTLLAPDIDGLCRIFPQYGLRRTRYGLWVEGNSTNWCLYCRDFTQTNWIKTTLTATLDQIGVDGGVLTSVVVANGGGSGYSVGDILPLAGGTYATPAWLKVATVSGSAVATATVIQRGLYNSFPASPANHGAPITGSGSGATFTLTYSKNITSLTATAPNASVLQSLTKSLGTTYCFSAYVKRVAGTGSIFMTMDGITYTDITSQINSNTYTLVSVPAQTGSTAYNCGFKIATSGDAIAVDLAQFEDSSYPTSPMYTASATNFRGPEAGFFNTTSTIYNDGQRLLQDINNSAGPVSVLIQWSGQNPSGFLFGDDLQGVFVKQIAGAFTTENSSSQLVSTANTASTSLYTLNKGCARYNGLANGLSACLNGGAIATGTGKLSPVQAISHGGTGNVGAGTAPVAGYISRLTLWNKELTDGQMIAFTS